MEFYETIRKRRSVRRYQNKAVERDKIARILEAARLAPSAENIQPWRIIVVDDAAKRDELCRRAFSGIYMPSRFACKAPVILVLLAKPALLVNAVGRQVRKLEFYLLDIGIMGEHIALAAVNEGLGTCWIGWFSERGVRKALDIGKKYKVVALMSMGYPLEDKEYPHRRRSIEEIVRYNAPFK